MNGPESGSGFCRNDLVKNFQLANSKDRSRGADNFKNGESLRYLWLQINSCQTNLCPYLSNYKLFVNPLKNSEHSLDNWKVSKQSQDP